MTYLLCALVVLGILHLAFPWRHIVRFPWILTGMVPLMLGILLNLLADHALKAHGTAVKPFEVSSSLVTEGVYRLSRNPMYLGFVLILAGTALCLGSLTPWGVVAIFGMLIRHLFIAREEFMLGCKFGDAWHVYAAKVRRWI